ncbi:MAG: MBL fold metallo-hydrolase [Ignavibacteriaceae bacterium]|nr:MBL fold metallo-hydrolase [Ignavibacteriaceae bacterium]
MIQIKCLVFNPFNENTYIVYDDNSSECLIIDPGCYTDEEETKLREFILSKKLTPKFLINTHCHIDHILGNSFVKKSFPVQFLAPEKDIPLLKNAAKQAEMFGIEIKTSPLPDIFINEEDDYKIGEKKFRFLFTPGHTPGEFCINFYADKICFTGDVLFKESIGRTDLWGGNFEVLINSIKMKLFTLPDETLIYPGHGERSSIGFEKLNNPFFH